MIVAHAWRQAWQLVQIAELLRRSHRMHERALTVLDRAEVDAELAADELLTLHERVATELELCGEAIAELAVQIQLLTSDLPAGALEISFDDLAREAGDDLASGIFDEHRALLAARVLPVIVGWPALAESLRASDAHRGWEQTTVEQLVGGFRDADPAVVRELLREAGVAPDLRFAACSPDQLERIADGLAARAEV
jgi:hypothetical protein